MSYQVEYSLKAMKTLREMDPSVRNMLVSWVRKNLEGCSDPRAHGKGLTANRSGQWRYRVGNYRLLAEIDDGKVTILIVSIGNRSNVYDQ